MHMQADKRCRAHRKAKGGSVTAKKWLNNNSDGAVRGGSQVELLLNVSL